MVRESRSEYPLAVSVRACAQMGPAGNWLHVARAPTPSWIEDSCLVSVSPLVALAWFNKERESAHKVIRM